MKVLESDFSVKYVSLLILIMLCTVCIVVFRTIPVSRIWNGYKVLYVDKSMAEDAVLDCLYAAGCVDVIALSLQKTPITTPFSAFQKDYGSYLKNRLGYFSDKENAYSLFYIPDQYERQAGSALKTLTRNFHVRAGIDSETAIPYIVPVITVALYIILGLSCSNRRYFFLPAFFPVVLSFSMPFYTVAAGACLFMFSLYLANRLWGRKSDVMALVRNTEADIILVSAFIVLCGQSVKCALLSFCSVCASISVLVLLKLTSAHNDSRSSFKYTLIFSAYQVPVINKKNMRVLLFMSIPISVLMISFLLSAKFMPKSSAGRIELPAPVRNAGDDSIGNAVFLPVMNDYFCWAWNTLTYPYRSVNYAWSETVTEGDSVHISQFVQKDSGIQEKDKVLYSYDSDFRKQLEKDLLGLDYPAVEILMDKQLHSGTVAYTVSMQNESSGRDIVSLVMLVVALAVPLLLCLSYNYGVKCRI